MKVKKLLPGLLAALLLTVVLTLLPAQAAESSDPYLQGYLGENCTWLLDTRDGTLQVFGTGATSDYDTISTPWVNLTIYDEIKTIIVHDGITVLGTFVFSDLPNLKEVWLPSSLEEISYGCFNLCHSLEYVRYSDVNWKENAKLHYLGKWAFGECSSLKYFIMPGNYEINYADEAIMECGTFKGCIGLSFLGFYGDSPAIVDVDALDDIPDGATVYYNAAYAVDNRTYTVGGETHTVAGWTDWAGHYPELNWVPFTPGGSNDVGQVGDASVLTVSATDVNGSTVTVDAGKTVTTDTGTSAIGGVCGESLNWKLEGGVLTIYGSGAMYDFG